MTSTIMGWKRLEKGAPEEKRWLFLLHQPKKKGGLTCAMPLFQIVLMLLINAAKINQAPSPLESVGQELLKPGQEQLSC